MEDAVASLESELLVHLYAYLTFDGDVAKDCVATLPEDISAHLRVPREVDQLKECARQELVRRTKEPQPEGATGRRYGERMGAGIDRAVLQPYIDEVPDPRHREAVRAYFDGVPLRDIHMAGNTIKRLASEVLERVPPASTS